MVITDEARLNARKGIFSIPASHKVLRDRILLMGYQSKISRTAGRVTAIGLLRRARMKKPSVMRWRLLKSRDNGSSWGASWHSVLAEIVYMVMLSKKKNAHRRSFRSATQATDSTCMGLKPNSKPVTPATMRIVRSVRKNVDVSCLVLSFTIPSNFIVSKTTIAVLAAWRMMFVR